MKLSQHIKAEFQDYLLLLRNIPSLVVALFVLSVVCMNLLANKELYTCEFFALDCGFTLSWFSFLCMDMICKRFGAKAAMKVSLTALVINLIFFALFNIVSYTPGMWGEYYSYVDVQPDVALTVNAALNQTIGGSWYVVFGSALAMFVSSLTNSAIYHIIAGNTRLAGFRKFALCSYVSTLIAQFVDNLVFAVVVSCYFFGWTIKQTLVCAIICAFIELFCEMIFSPIGYKMCQIWEKEGVGQEYLERN